MAAVRGPRQQHPCRTAAVIKLSGITHMPIWLLRKLGALLSGARCGSEIAHVYNDERATLHVELTEQAGSGGQPAGCADLYTVRQAPLMGMRLDPLPALGSRSIPSFTPEQIREDQERAWPYWKADRLRRCDIDAGKTAVDADISAADLASVTHIAWRTAAAPGKQPAFLTTATHFTVLDADTLAPNSGETIEGVHAGLSVDRASFNVGERVPLHIRWENVNASKPLGQAECEDPEPALEIQDSQHNVLRTIPTYSMCDGHGWGPFRVQKGKAQRTFRELTTRSTRTGLPGPGVYYLVSVQLARVDNRLVAQTLTPPGRQDNRASGMPPVAA
jgi:hypothetical protein